MDYALAKIIIKYVGGAACLLSLYLIFGEFKSRGYRKPGVWGWVRQQFHSLIAVEVIWLFLILEGFLFLAAWPIYGFSQDWHAGLDYLAFAAPCLAAIVVGVTIVYREGAPAANNGAIASTQGESPNGRGDARADGSTTPSGGSKSHSGDYLVYIIGLACLFAGFIGYVGSHFKYLTLVWIILVFCFGGFLAFLVPQVRRMWASRLGTADAKVLILGFLLFATVLGFGYFVIVSKDVFSGADSYGLNDCCCNNHKKSQ